MGKLPLCTCLVVAIGLTQACAAVALAQDGVVQATDADGRMETLLAKLSKVGEMASQAKVPAEMLFYNMEQAKILAELANASKGKERSQWVRQLADCLQMAAQNSPANDGKAYHALLALEQQMGRSMPGSDLAAYITYREIETSHNAALATPNVDPTPAQKQWGERLKSFVLTYPKAEDTADALMELASLHESLGQNDEAEVCYQQVMDDFAGKAQATKAAAALHWLELQGSVLHLTLPLLHTDNERCDRPFDITDLRGKLVVVYFWSSADQRWGQDFARLELLRNHYQSTGFEILCVNMDDTPQMARALVHGSDGPIQQASSTSDAAGPGVQVFERGGLQGFVATRHGITALPTVLLIDRDGHVLTRALDLASVEEDIRKRLE